MALIIRENACGQADRRAVASYSFHVCGWPRMSRISPMDVNLPRQGVGALVEKRLIRAIHEIRGQTSPDGHDDALALRRIGFSMSTGEMSDADPGREIHE